MLLLIVSITIDAIYVPFVESTETSVPTMLSMVFIAVTTPLQAISERKLTVPKGTKKHYLLQQGYC